VILDTRVDLYRSDGHSSHLRSQVARKRICFSMSSLLAWIFI